MKNVLKMLNNRLFVIFALVSLLALSCKQVYFEKPVPQQGAAMLTIPADWSGVYLAQPAGTTDLSLSEELFPQCFRLERLTETQLLVASEYRLHEKDVPRLRKLLDEQKEKGDLMNYQLSENMILCTIKTEDGRVEQQYTALLKKGSWYILTQTIAPVQLFDLGTGMKTNFDLNNGASLSSPWLPSADSLSGEAIKLVARQHLGHWYFNTMEESDKKWSLLYVEQLEKGQLLVKQSYLQNEEAFKNRLEYFNSITPFREVESGHFEIGPTDQALERLLAEKDLFQTTYLKRIEE